MNRRNRKKRLAKQAAQPTVTPNEAAGGGRNCPGRKEDREAPQEALLDMLEHGADQLQRLQRLLAKSDDPAMEMLVSLHRRIVLGLCARTDDPKVMLQLAGSAMKLLLAWKRIEEKRKDREFAERKFQKEQAGRCRDGSSGGLREETHEQIQNTLNLI